MLIPVNTAMFKGPKYQRGIIGMAAAGTMSGAKTVTTPTNTPQPASFANVQWLTGFDADPPTDESSYARTIADELISYETTTTKFGAGAGSWGNNSSARISINDVAGLDLLGKDFTLECFVYLLDTSSDHCFASNWHNASNRSWVWRWDQATSAMQFEYSTTGTTSAGTLSASWSPSTSTWYHVAVARNGNDLRFFVDGTQLGTTQTLSATLYNSSRQKHMGFSNNSVRGLYGYMDEARWVIDECIYTENFDVPTEAHPRS
jgi:hypothetical protein